MNITAIRSYPDSQEKSVARHHVFGEMSPGKWSMLSMTIIANDFSADGWVTIGDVARPLSRNVTEQEVRELFDAMIRHGWMEKASTDGGAVKRYRMTAGGVENVEAMLKPN